MTRYWPLILAALLLLVGSCDLDDAQSLNQKEIRDLYYDISLDFNLGNVYGILDHVHQDYLHKGQITYHLNEEILNRMGQFQLLEIEVLYIDIQGDHAIAHTIDHYESAYESHSYNEPDDTGLFSYLKRIDGSWLIYGDQMWIKSETKDILEGLAKAF